VVREYYQILPYGKEARRVILRTLLRAVRTMDNPADMINAALEELIKQRYEMPAFSTLDRLTGRVRTLVYGVALPLHSESTVCGRCIKRNNRLSLPG
jgi:uncharacterized protein DUF4158